MRQNLENTIIKMKDELKTKDNALNEAAERDKKI